METLLKIGSVLVVSPTEIFFFFNQKCTCISEDGWNLALSNMEGNVALDPSASPRPAPLVPYFVDVYIFYSISFLKLYLFIKKNKVTEIRVCV